MSTEEPTAKDFIRIYGVDGIGVENQANINRARRGIAKVKADALREAAEAWRNHLHATDASYSCPEAWLNGRADRIEADS